MQPYVRPALNRKGILKSLVHFVVFSSIFIAFCAIMMIHQTNDLLSLEYEIIPYFAFVFFATLCSYNFHWALSPKGETALLRLSWTGRNLQLHILLTIIGAIGAAILFFYFIEHWLVLMAGAILTFLYSAPKLRLLQWLRKIAVGKTFFLSMVWMYVTTAVPIFLAESNWNNQAILFCIARFLFIYSICILFDFRDREWDKKEGIRSIITALDEPAVDRLFASTLLIYTAVSISLITTGIQGMDIILLILPTFVMIPLYKMGKKNFSDYLYYIVLDGMMMFSSILTSLFNLI